MLDLLGSAAAMSADVAPVTRFGAAVAVCVAILALLATLAAMHRRRLATIQIRIHVTGTRGKSATVRLIAAAFRASGHRVVAKTTGTDPRLLLPDGTERPVRRWGAATI